PAPRAARVGASSWPTAGQSIREPGAVGTVSLAVMLILLCRRDLCSHDASVPGSRQDQKMDLPWSGGLTRVGAMKGYGQFCPVAVASEIFAERWTPLILRELFSGSRRFGEIRSGMPLISRTLLAQRLRELEGAGVVESAPLAAGRGRDYRLTRAGEEFREVVERLGAWGQKHVGHQFAPDNLDPSLLMWAMHRRIDTSRLLKPRVVVRFEFRGVPARCMQVRTAWLVLEKTGNDVCM